MFTIKIFLTLWFVGLLATSFAQDYRPGFIITPESDTLQGTIKYRGDINNAKRCRFKRGESTVDYAPSELLGYGFYDPNYFYVPKEISTDGKSELVFLEYLVDGIVDVYFYKDDRYFIESESDGLREIVVTQRNIEKDGITYVRTSTTHVGLLKSAFSDSPQISKRAETIAIQHKPLIELAKDYHYEVCTTGEECVVYEKRIPKSRLEIGIVGAYGFTEYVLESGNLGGFFYMDDAEFERAYSQRLGIGIRKNIPFISNRFSIQWNIMYNFSESASGSTVRSPAGFITLENHYKIETTRLYNALHFQYSFLNGWITPELGIFHSSLLSGDFESVYESTSDLTGETTRIGGIYSLNRNAVHPQVGFSMGVAAGKNISMAIRYQVGGAGQSLRLRQLSVNLFVPVWKLKI